MIYWFGDRSRWEVITEVGRLISCDTISTNVIEGNGSDVWLHTGLTRFHEMLSVAGLLHWRKRQSILQCYIDSCKIDNKEAQLKPLYM